jgi:hypothetical protein
MRRHRCVKSEACKGGVEAVRQELVCEGVRLGQEVVSWGVKS